MINHHTNNRRRGEVDDPNVRKLEDSSHPGGEIMAHEGVMQEISSHRPGLTDPAMSGKKETMRTRKQRWGRYALPIGFIEHKYPKDSNYLTISKNTMDHRNPSYGC
jgi:hypothetical protein